MAGNVWEWTLSLWGKDLWKPDFKYPYDPADGREDLAAADARVLRGGAWIYPYWVARCAFRGRDDPVGWYYFVGFRACVAAQQE